VDDNYTKLSKDWLADHPDPTAVTSNPAAWAAETSARIRQRIHDLADQLAPPTPGETYLDRVRRLNAAHQTATEVAIEEHLPMLDPQPDQTEQWVPLVPDISDLL